MKGFKKFVESCKRIEEAEYNKEWWDSKSDSFKKKYIEKHPNSIYAQKSSTNKDNSRKVNKVPQQKNDDVINTQSKADSYIRDELEDVEEMIGPREASKLRDVIYQGNFGLSPIEYANLSKKAAKQVPMEEFIEVMLSNDVRRFDNFVKGLK